MTKELLPIGSRESISFPEQGITNVPAKVDTGADSTSVWASNITEQNGELSFTLFAPGSHYYTGKKIVTRDYVVTYVRNSFGHTEERYKVKIPVRIRSKRVRVELTLADRSKNRYPVLIGKATLRNRFFVDVRRDGILKAKNPAKILVMNSKKSPGVKSFFDAINADNVGVECDFATYDDIRFDAINGAISCTVLSLGTKLSDYDLIYFKTYFARAEEAAAMTEVASAWGIPFIDEEVAHYHAKTKLTQYLRLARHGVDVPDSIVMSAAHFQGKYSEIAKLLGETFVMKDVAGEKGESNYVVRSEKEFEAVVEAAHKEKALYVAQGFVENDGDYRVVVLDKHVEMIIGRTITDTSTHLTNTSKGGTAKTITAEEFGAEPAGIAVRAAVIMNRQVAGVDLVLDKTTKKWLVFEVNNSPQIASGSYVEEKQAVMGRFLRAFAKK